jgi:adenylate cyclase
MTLMENEILISELKGHRTLATVVFTDCVGFSARMSVDEEHTLDLIRRDLKVMKGLCNDFEGRVLKSTGDGLLMCFSSAVKAVECAIAIQTIIAEDSAHRHTRDTLVHRIGIHLADMYITATDVMGNGVNIAARLQTEAEPGGICISQTVYDVAKHGLQLETCYLGPRELKNIREVVPAYKILLTPGDKADRTPYQEIANRFEQNQNHSRIKKLIFYVCRNRWENDSATLNHLNLESLIQEFLELAQTFDQLKEKLERVVKTLSKKIEYTLIANDILRGVSSFYALDNPSSPSLLIGTETSTHIIHRNDVAHHELESDYQNVALALDEHSDQLRIKKLLFYVCRRQWESVPQQLDKVATADLLQELQHQAPTSEQMHGLIDRFVQTLNKRAEYVLVAQQLTAQLAPLYPEAEFSSGDSTQLPTQSLVESQPKNLHPAIAQQLTQHPDTIRIKKLMLYLCRSRWISHREQLAAIDMGSLIEETYQQTKTPDSLKRRLDSAIKSLSKQVEYAPLAQPITDALKPLYSPKNSAGTSLPITKPDQLVEDINLPLPMPPVNQPAVLPKQTPSSQINLFDIRLGILKYANPLRAKILLFSALYSDFTFSYQDWLNLKQYELDALLQGILKTCPSYTDLELKLYSAANRSKTPEEQVQTADVIIKCLRDLYIHGSPLMHFASLGSNQISLDEFEAATLGFSKSASSEDGHTIQLEPASAALETNQHSSQKIASIVGGYEDNTCLLSDVDA